MRSCDWSDKDDVNLKASVTDFIDSKKKKKKKKTLFDSVILH